MKLNNHSITLERLKRLIVIEHDSFSIYCYPEKDKIVIESMEDDYNLSIDLYNITEFTEEEKREIIEFTDFRNLKKLYKGGKYAL